MTNFIEVYDNALSSDQCQRVIDYFESSNEKEYEIYRIWWLWKSNKRRSSYK